MSQITQLISIGGPIVWILCGLSVFAATIAIAKCWQLWLYRPDPSANTQNALKHLQANEHLQAVLMLKNVRNPNAKVFRQTLVLFEEHKLSVEDIKLEAFRLARASITELGKFLRPLEVIASMAPLLGLLGTVIGMIAAFQAMEMAGSQVNPSVLSGGIWQALLTTAVGLVVAIPVTIIHSWLERRVECQATELQNDLEQLFTIKCLQQQSLNKKSA
jgi:biopolymer transport protein ExbB